MLDIGRIEDLYDGNSGSVARTFEANPFMIELNFSKPRQASGLNLVVGGAQVQVTANLFPDVGALPVEYNEVVRGTFEDPQDEMEFPAVMVHKLHLEVLDLHQSEPAHIHLWESTLD